MMGEYLLYYNDILFGGIYDDRLLVKNVDSNKKYNMQEAIPYNGAKPMYLVDDVDNQEILKDIVLDTYKDLKKQNNQNRCINYNGIIIYYNRNTEFDKMMLEELKQYYSRIITINSKFKDQILDDYQMLIQSMYLTKYIAERKFKDLSKVEYSPIVKKIYKYNGDI